MRYFTLILIIFSSFNCLAQTGWAMYSTTLNDVHSDNDSLIYKRVFLKSVIRYREQKQFFRRIIDLYETSPKAKAKYKTGKHLSPIAIASTLGGAGLTYVALKGNDKSAVVRGASYDYKVRSLPKLMIGLGLFAGGLCLLEYSNELIKTSVEIYNTQRNSNTSLIKSWEVGLTGTDRIGLRIRF